MSLFKSIATFGGFTLISRFTGFARDMILANFLGAGAISDAFLSRSNCRTYSEACLPKALSTTAFVPMLSHKLVSDGRDDAVRFAAQAISVLTFF